LTQKVVRAVDHQRTGDNRQVGQSPEGGQPQRRGHAPPVTFGRAGVPDGPARVPRRNVLEDRFATDLMEQFRVAQPQRHRAARDAGRKDRDTNAHRSCPGPPPDFVKTADPLVALLPQLTLLVQRRPGAEWATAGGAGHGPAGSILGHRSQRASTARSAGSESSGSEGSGSNDDTRSASVGSNSVSKKATTISIA